MVKPAAKINVSTSCIGYNINWRDVQRKNVVNNVDMSSVRAPWQTKGQCNITEQSKIGCVF